MSKGTIKYSQEFKSIINGNQWIGIDMVVNDGEQWDEKFKEALDLVKGFARMAESEYNKTASTWNRHEEPLPSQPIPSLDYKAKERVEILIENSVDEKELANYKESAAEYGLTTQYMSRLKSFQK